MSTTMDRQRQRLLGAAARPLRRTACAASSPARSSSASCATCPSPPGSSTGEVYGAPLAEHRPLLEVDAAGGVLRPARTQPDDRASASPTWPASGASATGTDLADALAPFAERLTDLIKPVFYKLRHTVLPRGLNPANTKDGAKKNIEAHYDLSNEMFQQFLDPIAVLLLGAVRDARPGADAGRPRGGPARQGRRHPRLRRRHRGLTRPGDRHRLGHARHPRRPARRDRHHGHPLGRAGRPRAAACRRGRASPTGSRSPCATTATRPASSTPSSAWR